MQNETIMRYDYIPVRLAKVKKKKKKVPPPNAGKNADKLDPF